MTEKMQYNNKLKYIIKQRINPASPQQKQQKCNRPQKIVDLTWGGPFKVL